MPTKESRETTSKAIPDIGMSFLKHQALRPVVQVVVVTVTKAARPISKALTTLSGQCSFSDTDPPSSYIFHRAMQKAMSRLCSLLAAGAMAANALGGNKIDTHFHALPPAYVKALASAGGDPSGFPTPEWSLDAAIGSMDTIGTSIGVPIAGTGAEARKLARTLNDYLADTATSDESGGRLGFFGVLPDWQDVNGTLAELDYLYAQQKLCNGVTVYTTYGARLLGDPLFSPIWDRLQEYKALVFTHPGVMDVEPKFIASSLPQPIIDYPLATTRTAVDLVMTGTFRRCPDVDIILSHAGGTIPFVGSRAIAGLAIPEVASKVGYSLAKAKADFGRFYYDIALSTSAAQLEALLDFAEPSHVLFGSDFPYAPQLAIDVVVAEYAAFVGGNARGAELSVDRLRENSLGLLNKHAQSKSL